MSRIGKQPINVPSGVKVVVSSDRVQLEGPKGKMESPLPEGITCAVDDSLLTLRRTSDSKSQKALHGLARSLLANAVQGTSVGFTKDLEIQGIGYRAEVQGKQLSLNIGYSHLVNFDIPSGISINVEKQVRISVSGVNKQQVGQVAADIRSVRPPEPYKGKGIRYVGEHVRRKVGKTGA